MIRDFEKLTIIKNCGLEKYYSECHRLKRKAIFFKITQKFRFFFLGILGKKKKSNSLLAFKSNNYNPKSKAPNSVKADLNSLNNNKVKNMS